MCVPWRRKWQPTPVLLPGKSHGPRILVGYNAVAFMSDFTFTFPCPLQKNHKLELSRQRKITHNSNYRALVNILVSASSRFYLSTYQFSKMTSYST